MTGKLIVFEGVEGSGKTTQIQRVDAWLREHPKLQQLSGNGQAVHIYRTREPGGTEIGQVIRRLLLDHSRESAASMHDYTELLLYASDRAQHVHELLKPVLARGGLVLCDRYTDSTVAYQGYGRGLSLDLIYQLNQIATVGLESDLTIWLDLDVEVGLVRTQRRGIVDRIEQADLEFHRRVQHGFSQLAQAQPQRMVRIDASGSETEVLTSIQAVLEQRLTEWYPAI